MRRALSAIALGAAALIATAAPAHAHAVLESSTPASGARVDAVDTVALRLSERPDPALSSVQAIGDPFDLVLGDLEVVDGRTLVASIESQSLPGTSVVSWRVFSAVDGHVTAGAFAFGFQADPQPVELPEQQASGVTPIGVAGRILFLLGVALAFGSVTIETLSPLAVRALPLLAVGGVGAGLLGVAMLGHQQRVDSGASITTFLGTTIGHAVFWRAGALVVAAGLAVAWRRWMRVRHLLAPLTGAAVGVAVVVHVLNGHAGVGGSVQIALQVLHVLALSAWVGAFVPLLAAIASGNARRVVERFSTVALPLVVVVVVTGQLRALDELDWSVSAVFATAYGRVIVAKWIVLVAILTFVWLNRSRNVTRVSEDPAPLRSAVRAEATLGVVVIGLAGLLADLAPTAAAVGPHEATVLGQPATGSTEVPLPLATRTEQPAHRGRLRSDDHDGAL